MHVCDLVESRNNISMSLRCIPDGSLDVRKFVLWSKSGQILPTLRPESVFTVARF